MIYRFILLFSILACLLDHPLILCFAFFFFLLMHMVLVVRGEVTAMQGLYMLGNVSTQCVSIKESQLEKDYQIVFTAVWLIGHILMSFHQDMDLMSSV